MEVRKPNDGMKCRIFEKGIRTKCMFCKKLGLKGAGSRSDLLTRSHPYINYEEKLMAEGIKRDKVSEKSASGRDGDAKRQEPRARRRG